MMRHLYVNDKEYVLQIDRVTWDDKVEDRPQDMPSTEGVIKDIRFTFTQGETCFHREQCTPLLRGMLDKDRELGLKDIRYNFLISNTGAIYEGRGWNSLPADPQSGAPVRPRTIDVAYIGNFQNLDLPINMYVAGLNLIKYGIKMDLIEQACSISYYKPPGAFPNFRKRMELVMEEKKEEWSSTSQHETL